MWFLWLFIGLAAVLFVIQKFREAQASRLIQGEWTMHTSLPPALLHESIVKSMKGLNPLARVSLVEDGVYEREISQGTGKHANASLIRVSVFAEEDGRGSYVHCAIAKWEGPRRYGMNNVSSVFKARRRILAVISKMKASDPAAVLLAVPD